MEYIYSNAVDLMTVSEAARVTGVSLQRFRRALKILQIPVTKLGWNVLVTKAQAAQVKKAFKDGKIAPGRKRA